MVSGTSYAFGIFSEILKDRLDFQQVDVALIGSFGSTGLYMVSLLQLPDTVIDVFHLP